jgi:NosR/NirI family transcriptional regulator, nitrous oxide reductase regulator
MAKANPDVYLAHLLIDHPEITQDLDNLDVQTFLGSGRTMDSLVEDAGQVQSAFKTGGWFLGAYLGLVIGIMIISPMIIRRRTDYQPNRGDCFSCGRCLKYCPVQK